MAVPSAAGSVTEQQAQHVAGVTAAMPAKRRLWHASALTLNNDTSGQGGVIPSLASRKTVGFLSGKNTASSLRGAS